MRPVLCLLLLLPVIVTAQYKLSPHFLQYNPVPATGSFTFENLRLYPVLARDSFKRAFKDLSRFTTLKEALEKKKIRITETGTGGTVNTLQVENLSKDTIILNCGEVIKGGKQDRVINADIVLYPGSGKKDLPVFCVEQGRWTSTARADGKNFDGYYNFSKASLRKVVATDKEQTKVWSEVSKINSANKSENSTSAYTKLEDSKEYADKIERYTAFFKTKINSTKDIVGVIAVTGDRIISVDLFASNELFRQNFDGLLYSYASEAIINGKVVTISTARVDAYMKDLLNEKKQDSIIRSKGSQLQSGNKKLRISSFE